MVPAGNALGVLSRKFHIRPAGSALGVQGAVVFRDEAIHVVCRVPENRCNAVDGIFYDAII